MTQPGMRLCTEPIYFLLDAVDDTVTECADRWPSDQFDTPDNRRFRLLYDGDRIFSRDSDPLNPADRKWLDLVVVAIVELCSNDKPLYFFSSEQGDQAWVDLQALFGVKSELASDPDWETFPEPTRPSIQ